MPIEEVGSHGEHKVYKDTNPPEKMGYWGMVRVAGDPPSFGDIRVVLDRVVEKIKRYPEGRSIDRDELIGFLGMVREMTEPAPEGFYYCPYVPLDGEPVINPATFDPTKGIITRFGKKLMAKDALMGDNQ